MKLYEYIKEHDLKEHGYVLGYEILKELNQRFPILYDIQEHIIGEGFIGLQDCTIEYLDDLLKYGITGAGGRICYYTNAERMFDCFYEEIKACNDYELPFSIFEFLDNESYYKLLMIGNWLSAIAEDVMDYEIQNKEIA